MHVLHDNDRVPAKLRGAVATVGVFDGVHVGHQALLQTLVKTGAERAAPSLVVTFDRHPASVVRPESAPHVLTSLRHRLELFAAHGIDAVRVVAFDEERSVQAAGDFARSVLIEELEVGGLVIGRNFRFGLRRGGDVGTLGEIADEHRVALIVVPPVTTGSPPEPVSSGMVRRLLAAGEVEPAALLLGRDHEVRGTVERGDQRGRTLGFPTANVAVGGDIMLPADGVYGGRYVFPDGADWPAAVSIGRRPTFYAEAGLLLVEAHLIDFEGDLYGQRAGVRISHFVRGQERFESAEALIAEMDRDLVAIRTLEGLGGSGPCRP